MTSLAEKGKIDYVTAFSRDGERKVYVQHRIEEHGDHVTAMMMRGAVFYLAGSAKSMPAAVTEAVEGALVRYGGMDEKGAKECVATWKRQGRFQMETWA